MLYGVRWIQFNAVWRPVVMQAVNGPWYVIRRSSFCPALSTVNVDVVVSGVCCISSHFMNIIYFVAIHYTVFHVFFHAVHYLIVLIFVSNAVIVALLMHD
jgi:hypothetical protein